MEHVIYQKEYDKNNEIIYSIVTPVYNQENIIVKNIRSFIEFTTQNFEIIIILDFCDDNTETNLLKFFQTYSNTNSLFKKITIFKTSHPLFETKCDNIGFRYASGKFCLEIQADMEMIQMGYNESLARPFNILPNVIAVSGRCAHSLFGGNGRYGKLGRDILKSIEELNVDKNTFYVSDTCNRGPLLIDRVRMEELGYLDETKYFLDNSDHDLMIRARMYKNYICGYIPINFNSLLEHGSTRKPSNNNINNEEKARLNKLLGNGQAEIDKYKDKWVHKSFTVEMPPLV